MRCLLFSVPQPFACMSFLFIANNIHVYHSTSLLNPPSMPSGFRSSLRSRVTFRSRLENTSVEFRLKFEMLHQRQQFSSGTNKMTRSGNINISNSLNHKIVIFDVNIFDSSFSTFVKSFVKGGGGRGGRRSKILGEKRRDDADEDGGGEGDRAECVPDLPVRALYIHQACTQNIPGACKEKRSIIHKPCDYLFFGQMGGAGVGPDTRWRGRIGNVRALHTHLHARLSSF